MIKDSGNRREFATGAVRDIQEGKGRCDLLPLDVVGAVLYDDTFSSLAEFIETRDPISLRKALSAALNKPNMDGKLMFNGCMPTMFLEVSVHFEEGAVKYGIDNWRKGLPINCYIDSAVRHYLKWIRGDEDERHDRAFVWNVICCMWEVSRQRRTEGSVAV